MGGKTPPDQGAETEHVDTMGTPVLGQSTFQSLLSKKWSAHLRLVGRVEKAQEREDIIRWSKAKNGGLLNDVKREKFKDLGFGSIEAMDQSLKRTRQQLKHYKPNSFDQFEAMEKRIREGYKKQ
jgi:hypothetical protein